MAKIKKYEKDGEQRIDLTVTDAELWEAGRKAAEEVDSKNEKLLTTYEKALKLAGGAAPSMFVEPIDEKTSRCYVIGKDGERIDLGEIPTFNALEKQGEIRFSALEKHLKEWEAEQIERNKLIMDSLGALDMARIGGALKSATEAMSEQMRPATEAMKEWGSYTSKLFEELSGKSYFKGVSEMLSAIQEALSKSPVFSLYATELEKLSKDPAFKDADVYRPGLDYEDEAETIPADTLHNKALLLAMENARAATEQEAGEEEQPTLFDEIEKAEEAEATPLPQGKLEGKSLIKQTQVVSKASWLLATMKNVITNGTWDVETPYNNRIIVSKLEVTAPENLIVKGLESLTGFENEVANGLYTLYENGYRSFTLPKLYEAMTLEPEPKITAAMQSKLETNLEKFAVLRIKIDASKEVQAYTKDPGAKYRANRYFFQLESEFVSIGGVKAKMYYFTGDKPPILLEHARLTNRLATIPRNLIQIKNSKGHTLPNTTNRIAIRGYLYRRIRQMKDPRTGDIKKGKDGQSNRILFETLYDAIQLQPTDRNTEKNYRDNIFEILDHWKREGEIKRYEIVKGGRGGAIKGVDIFFK